MHHALIIALALLPSSPPAPEVRWTEGALRGYPTVRDEGGKIIADGTLTQTVNQGVLRTRTMLAFTDGTRVVERSAFGQGKVLEQLRWSWEERRGDAVLRSFSVDLTSGRAIGAKRKGDGTMQRWDKHLGDVRGAFVGMGFLYAVKNLRERLDAGERIKLVAVAFTPTPRLIKVSLSRDATDTLQIGGRGVSAVRYTIHPEIPAVARLFIDAPDQHIWLSAASPPAFLRGELSFVEPSDPIIHVEASR